MMVTTPAVIGTHAAIAAGSSPQPAAVAAESETHAPSTNMSEWAKLMNFKMPYTIV
jgi:hypothetical protein